MFDLQIDKKKEKQKKCLQWIKVVKKTTHSQNILHVDVLYNIKKKKYKTKTTIDYLFACKQIIWPHFFRMQSTLLVTGKNE